MAVRVPVKELLARAAAAVELVLALHLERVVRQAARSFSGTMVGVRLDKPVRVALEAEFLLALTCSLSTMVKMSPTIRGRRSSNSGW